MALDLITVGRISVDLYAQEAYQSFADPQTFRKSIGGSPTNVAVAAARLGLAAAVATKVGSDPLAPYVLGKLTSFGVDTEFVGIEPGGQTPVVLASLDPPEDPSIIFYRGAAAPDTNILASDISPATIQEAKALWISACALATGETAAACFNWLEQRARKTHTLIDLDYRPSLWSDVTPARAAAQRAIALSTVVVGNIAECDMAIGETDPLAIADNLLNRGVTLACIKMGGGGVLLASATERVRVEPLRIQLVCGLGAGDAFGGALVYGLINGLSLLAMGELANGAGAYVASRLMCADSMPQLEALTDFISVHRKGSST
ncbi:MAG: PfkB family carbohydrate kinase [Actinobacteria bacterium]|nr:PfkB family carbohydrate kinase [Actinomycetota bacterium]